VLQKSLRKSFSTFLIIRHQNIILISFLSQVVYDIIMSYAYENIPYWLSNVSNYTGPYRFYEDPCEEWDEDGRVVPKPKIDKHTLHAFRAAYQCEKIAKEKFKHAVIVIGIDVEDVTIADSKPLARTLETMRVKGYETLPFLEWLMQQEVEVCRCWQPFFSILLQTAVLIHYNQLIQPLCRVCETGM